MTPDELLDYEVSSSWWACWLGSPYLQTLAAKYFAWKVERKYRLLLIHNEWKRQERWKEQIAKLASEKPKETTK